MDAIGARSERATAEGEIVVLTDREDRPSGRVRQGDRRDRVVGPRRQVDDHAVDVQRCRLESGKRADRDGDRVGAPNEVGQPSRPDEVIRDDRDPGGQSSVSAR
jgi:hypothetical protein